MLVMMINRIMRNKKKKNRKYKKKRKNTPGKQIEEARARHAEE